LDDAQRDAIARKLLANAVIEDVHFASHTPPDVQGRSYDFKITEIPIRNLDDAGLTKLSKEGDLFLNLNEMKAIQEYFRSLAREPRDVELEMIAQTWSEHCVHKTFRSDVAYSGSPLPGDWEFQWKAADAAELESLRAELQEAILGAGYAGEYLDEHLAALMHAAAAELPAGPATITLHVDSQNTLDRVVRVNGKRVVAFSWANSATKGEPFRLRIPNLIKNTIFKATQDLAKPWCISVFKDNAGVIEFDEQHAVCFKVETHNHPSALDPYGGAGTGIGGVVRDPMGTGMGAKPVANTDIFCFGLPDMDLADVPKGVLHPRRVMRGVVAGVRDYGNRMGIPTVNGAVYFDGRYLGNPLVFCGTVGLLPREKCFKQVGAGDAVVVVGGRTGRDGIHGATFSSGELTHEHETDFSNAVQIGNAITEKKMLDTILQARDLGLYTAITDCGAGGLSSAVGEMAEEFGAEVHLDRVPLKYAGLSYSEIWISEAQERMVLSVPQENLEKILAIFRAEGVEATVIGTFGVAQPPSAGSVEENGKTQSRATVPQAKLRLLYNNELVCELGMHFLQEGLPRPTKEAHWEKRVAASVPPQPRDNYNKILLKILSLPNVASKEWIIRQYDHEVQGGSALKPLVGVAEDSPGDAAVVRPVLDSRKGVVISCGMNPLLGDLDPYQSALHAVDEALRNAVAVGGNLDRTAILDNFCWGNCNKPDRMGALVQSAKACYDAAMAYGTPFVSGKDSLNNEFVTERGETIAVPPTLLISAISVIDDVARCVSSDAKEPGDYVFILGRTGGELGGSHYLLAEGSATGTDVPPVDLATNRRVMAALQAAIQAGTVRACHDLSEGGLAVAAAEMAFGGELGVDLNIAAMPGKPQAAASDAASLFNESAGRFLVEVAPQHYDAFLRIVQNVPFGELGRVTATGRVVIRGEKKTLIDLEAGAAKNAWQGTFKGF
jgi:phosphoribosylformylglycinamidine synthase